MGPVPTSPHPPLIMSSWNRRQSDHSNMYIRSRHSSVPSLHCSMLFIKTSTILIVSNSSLGISRISNMFVCSPSHLSAPFTLASLLFLKHTTCIPAQGIYTCSLWTSPHVNFLERMCLKTLCEIVTPSLESISLVSPPSVSGLYNAVPLVDNTM